MKKRHIILALTSVLFINACKKDNNTEVTEYQLVADSSFAIWKGYLKTGYFNEGSIHVESRNIQVEDGKVKSGSFKMPLSGLENFNLPTEELKEQLIHHLQSADFFNMALHPDISFNITSVTSYKGNEQDAVTGANYTVKGNLSLLGKPLEISFPARITTSADNMYVAAKLKVDRTRWGITYATADTLADDQFIMPDMDIELNLKGVKK